MLRRNHVIGYALVAIFLFITPLHAKSGYRKIWVKAKKKAAKQFEELYEKISSIEKNKKKRRALLKELGLNAKKSSLEKNIEFKSDLGPTLDKLRKAYDKYKKAVKNNFIAEGPARDALEKIFESKKLYQELLAFTKKEASEENLLFLQDAKKKKGAVLFATYVSEDAVKMINVSFKTRQKWTVIANNNAWKSKEYDEALKAATYEIFQLVLRDTFRRFKLSNSLQEAVTTEKEKVINLIAQVREICDEYADKIVKTYTNLEKGLKGDIEGRDIEFHETLINGLDAIEERVSGLEQKLK